MQKISWLDANSYDLIVQVLENGGVVAGLSDTVPGLLACATDREKAALDGIKGRSEKPYIVLAASLPMVLELIAPECAMRFNDLINKAWPGPITLVFKTHPAKIVLYGPTIAVRIPDYEPLQRLLVRVGPLYSTSANSAGRPTPTSIEAIEQAIADKVDLVVSEMPVPEAGTHNVASALLDCTGQEIRVVRSREPIVSHLEQQLRMRFVRY